jgi:hypothetical protein
MIDDIPAEQFLELLATLETFIALGEEDRAFGYASDWMDAHRLSQPSRAGLCAMDFIEMGFENGLALNLVLSRIFERERDEAFLETYYFCNSAIRTIREMSGDMTLSLYKKVCFQAIRTLQNMAMDFQQHKGWMVNYTRGLDDFDLHSILECVFAEKENPSFMHVVEQMRSIARDIPVWNEVQHRAFRVIWHVLHFRLGTARTEDLLLRHDFEEFRDSLDTVPGCGDYTGIQMEKDLS